MTDPLVDWEELNADGSLERIAVPGGHLYRTTVFQQHHRETEHGYEDWEEVKGVALCFVPEPHEAVMKRMLSGDFRKMLQSLITGNEKECPVCLGSGAINGGPCPMCKEKP